MVEANVEAFGAVAVVDAVVLAAFQTFLAKEAYPAEEEAWACPVSPVAYLACQHY